MRRRSQKPWLWSNGSMHRSASTATRGRHGSPEQEPEAVAHPIPSQSAAVGQSPSPTYAKLRRAENSRPRRADDCVQQARRPQPSGMCMRVAVRLRCLNNSIPDAPTLTAEPRSSPPLACPRKLARSLALSFPTHPGVVAFPG
jgi:hypothetical protein